MSNDGSVVFVATPDENSLETEETNVMSAEREITVVVPERLKNVVQQMIDNYADSTISATVLPIEGTDGEALSYLDMLLSADQLPDVILSADANIVKLVESDSSAFLRYQDYGELSDYSNFKIGNLYQSDNSIYGIPFDGMPMAFYYNKDLLKELGVEIKNGITWDEFITIGKKFRAEFKKPMLPYPDNETVFTMLKSYGVCFYDENKIMTLDGCEQVLEFFNNLQHEGLFSNEDVSLTKEVEQLFSGDIGGIIAAPYIIKSIQEKCANSEYQNWGVIELPKSDIFKYNVNAESSCSWLVKRSRDEESNNEIIAWLEALISANMMQYVGSEKLIPVKDSMINDCENLPQEEYFDKNVIYYLATIGRDIPIVIRGKKIIEFSGMLYEKAKGILSGELSVAEALEQLDDEMKDDSPGGGSESGSEPIIPLEHRCFLKIVDYPKQEYYEGDPFVSAGLKVKFVIEYKKEGVANDCYILNNDSYAVNKKTLQIGDDHVDVIYIHENIKYVASIPVHVKPRTSNLKNKEKNTFGNFPKVNLLTGDVTYESGDLSVGANRNAISIFHVYNSDALRFYRDENTGMGSGWKLNIQQYLLTVNSKLYYIDASGYMHEFRDNSIGKNSDVYQDVDGDGLTLYRHKTFGEFEDCSILKDSGDNYLVFNAEGRMIRMIPAPCTMQNLTTARAIVVQYDNEKLVSVYDNKVAEVKVLFDYSGDNISKISVKKGAEIIKQVEFSYGEGNILTARKKGNLIEKYSYNGVDYNIGEIQYSHHLLEGIVSEETKCAAKIEYIANSAQVETVRTGCIDGNGSFVEKSRSEFLFKKNVDKDAVTKTDVTNEKGICIEYMFNENGEIVSSFEKKTGGLSRGLFTLQKETGKRMPVNQGPFGESINGVATFTPDNNICSYAPEFDLRRGKEAGVRNYIAGCYVKLKEKTVKNLQAIVFYTFNNQKYSYSAKVDNTAVNVWQKIGVTLTVPKDTADDAMKISNFSLAIYDEAGNTIAAEYSDILIAPGGTMSTFLTSGTSKFELRSATSVELTDENDSVTLIVGEELKLNEKKLVFNKINLTYNDLLETAKSMYVNKKNGTGFFFFYNGGKDRYANVKDVKIVFDSVKVPIADVTTGYCNFVLTQYSADGGTVTDVMNTLKDKGILCETTITVNSADTSKSSKSYEYTTYDGRKLYEEDAYGVKTSYEYDSFYNLTCVKRSGNGKEMLLSKTEYDEQGEYLKQTSAGYSSSRYEYNKPFETLKEESERSYDLSNGIYSNTGLKKTVDYDENERIKSVKLSKDSTTFFKNDVTYTDGKIRTVSDGNSKYGIKYDIENDSVTYTAFDGETEVDIQKHYDRYDGTAKHNISKDEYFKGNGQVDTITSVTDDYGRILSTDDGKKNIEYSYTKSIHNNESQLVFRGYDGIALLSKVKDPYENKEYSYSYDYDGQMCGWEEAGKISVRKLSANDTKYTFGENNNRSEKYKTEEKYDENVVNQPRVFGSKTYEDTQIDAQDNWSEIDLFNVGYTYDELGRIKTKTGNKGEYTYSYLTDDTGALLPNIRNISFAFGKDTGKKWTYGHGYDNKGNLSAISLTKNLGGQNIGTTYTYDDANRLSGETIKVGGTTVVDNSYHYQENGKGRLIKIEDKLDGNKSKEFYYDGRGRIDYYRLGAVNYKYTYDNFGNVVKKAAGSTLYSCSWERGNLLKQVTKNGMSASYEYNHRCVRFRKTVNGVSTEYYLDGAKILGESRSDGKELRYFYDHDGLIGFKYNGDYYGYIKDGQDNIVAIVDDAGSLMAQYEYDSFGKTTVKDSSGNVDVNVEFIGNLNPFRWKSFYYDAETGFYYANGRYYEVERGGYIDAIEADVVEGNAYNVMGLDRNGIMLLTLIMLAPYSETIATALQLYADPTYDPNEGVEVEEETPKSWWKKHWWEVLVAAVNIVVGVVKLATGNVTGILNIISGIFTLVGAIFSEQLAGAMGTATLGVQTIMIGVQSLSCNPVYGIIAMAVGAACVAFATAEAQESLGYGNWLKDTVGMSDEVYNGVMVAVNVAAIAINIVGVKQCFKEGTLVACLNENGEEVRKPIETVAVGTLVLAYDEATGEKAYKPVVQLFKNETKRWCTVTVEVDGQEEQIVSTPGHKYYLPNNTESREIGLKQEHESYIMLSEKWVSACKLKSGDKVLLSDGKYGIIVSVKIEELEIPETTYNFEVADFHTYYVSDSNVLVHNMCKPESPKKLNNSEIKKFDAEGYKKTYVNNKGSRFDIFKDSANNDKIWLGSKDQKTWIETFEHLIDLLNGDW